MFSNAGVEILNRLDQSTDRRRVADLAKRRDSTLAYVGVFIRKGFQQRRNRTRVPEFTERVGRCPAHFDVGILQSFDQWPNGLVQVGAQTESLKGIP